MVSKSDIVLLVVGAVIALAGGHVFQSNFKGSISLDGSGGGSIPGILAGGALMLVGMAIYLIVYTRIRREKAQ